MGNAITVGDLSIALEPRSATWVSIDPSVLGGQALCQAPLGSAAEALSSSVVQ